MAYSSLTYPYGRPVLSAITVTRQRPIPAGATPLVSVGERVAPDRVLAEQRVDRGVTNILAGIAGTVSAIAVGRAVTIQGIGAQIHGVVGVGGPTAGPLYTFPRGESLAVAHIPHGCILLLPTRAPLMLLQRALASGAAGVIAASATALELEAFARADLTSLLEGQAPPTAPQPLTVALTEGVGEAMMDSTIWHHLTQRLGDVALLNGQTLPQRAIRPEILLSIPEGAALVQTPLPSTLIVGAVVRVWAGPVRGQRGRITHLYSHEQSVASGQLEPSAHLHLEGGASLVAPLQQLDVIG